MPLTDVQKQFYSAMEGTFNTPGWKLISEGWQTEANGLADVVFHNAKTMDDLYTARVRYGLLNELIGLPATIAAQQEAIEQQDEDAMHNV